MSRTIRNVYRPVFQRVTASFLDSAKEGTPKNEVVLSLVPACISRASHTDILRKPT